MTLIEQLQYFKQNAHRADEYFQAKGISARVQQEFELGFCPENCPKEVYPFRGRVIVPINNTQGDLVAFGGRTLGSDHPKWVNSSESDVYKKSRLLYNLDKAQDYILSSGLAIVVEGYFDVTTLWDAGLKHVVASCGTSLTKYQVRLLKRFANELVICYDGDSAGVAAAERAVEGLADECIPIKYASLPPGVDPDDYVRTEGLGSFLKLIDGAKG
jgi:DNA primase